MKKSKQKPKTKLIEVAVQGCGCGACNRYGFHMEVKRVEVK